MTGLEAFGALDLRVGRVLAAEPLAGARKPAYKLSIDLGALGLKGSSAQITASASCVNFSNCIFFTVSSV